MLGAAGSRRRLSMSPTGGSPRIACGSRRRRRQRRTRSARPSAGWSTAGQRDWHRSGRPARPRTARRRARWRPKDCREHRPDLGRVPDHAAPGQVAEAAGYGRQRPDAAGTAEMRFGIGAGKQGVVVLLTLGPASDPRFIDGKLVPNTEFGQMEIRGRPAERRLRPSPGPSAACHGRRGRRTSTSTSSGSIRAGVPQSCSSSAAASATLLTSTTSD